MPKRASATIAPTSSPLPDSNPHRPAITYSGITTSLRIARREAEPSGKRLGIVGMVVLAWAGAAVDPNDENSARTRTADAWSTAAALAVMAFAQTFLVFALAGAAIVIADIDAGLLYILALTSLGVYGIVLAGWEIKAIREGGPLLLAHGCQLRRLLRLLEHVHPAAVARRPVALGDAVDD